MSQFEEDLEYARTALTQLFSRNFSIEFDNLINDGEYDGEAIIDDIEDEDDSNIIDGMQIADPNQSKLFCKTMIDIFKHHKHSNIEPVDSPNIEPDNNDELSHDVCSRLDCILSNNSKNTHTATRNNNLQKA